MTQVVAGGTASRRLSPVTALLSLDAVGVRRRAGDGAVTDVLDDVSLEVSPGEFVAVVGGRRSGKTSLLRVAAGYEPPSAGVIRVCGYRITNVSGGVRARRTRPIGYVPKELQLAAGKRVLDHLMLPLIAERVPLTTASARVHEALDRVGSMELASAGPHDLGAGQQALVSLARALVRRPRLLLVDELGAKSQPEERDHLFRVLHGVVRDSLDLAVVLTTRDEAGSAGATHTHTLSDGRLTGATPGAHVVPLPARVR